MSCVLRGPASRRTSGCGVFLTTVSHTLMLRSDAAHLEACTAPDAPQSWPASERLFANRPPRSRVTCSPCFIWLRSGFANLPFPAFAPAQTRSMPRGYNTIVAIAWLPTPQSFLISHLGNPIPAR